MTEKPGIASFSDESFKHYEEITITSIGQPMFNYVAQSWHPETDIPMYRQTGFLHIVPGTVDIVSLDIVYDLGVVTIEEETTNAASSEYLTQVYINVYLCIVFYRIIYIRVNNFVRSVRLTITTTSLFSLPHTDAQSVQAPR